MHDLKAAVIHLVDRHGNRFGIQRLARGLRSSGDVARAARDQIHVVNDERQAVAVGDGGNGLDVRNVAVRVAQRLKIDGARVRLDRCLF